MVGMAAALGGICFTGGPPFRNNNMEPCEKYACTLMASRVSMKYGYWICDTCFELLCNRGTDTDIHEFMAGKPLLGRNVREYWASVFPQDFEDDI